MLHLKLELKEFVAPGNGAIVGAVSGLINLGGPGFGTLTATFNQAGLSATYVSGVTDFATFVAGSTYTTVIPGFEWFSQVGSRASVTYDLGSLLTIDRMALWNEESAGIDLLDQLISSDDVTFTALLSDLFPTDNPIVAYSANVFSFAATSSRYIRMDMSRCLQPNGRRLRRLGDRRSRLQPVVLGASTRGGLSSDRCAWRSCRFAPSQDVMSQRQSCEEPGLPCKGDPL